MVGASLAPSGCGGLSDDEEASASGLAGTWCAHVSISQYAGTPTNTVKR